MAEPKPDVRIDSASQPFEYLQRLDLRTDCGRQDVIVAYRRRARRVHPDHGGSKEEFMQLRKDYEHALAYVDRRRASPVQSMPHQTTRSVTMPPPTKDASLDFVYHLVRVASYTGIPLLFGYYLPFNLMAALLVVFCLTLIPLSVLGIARMSRMKSTITYGSMVYAAGASFVFLREPWMYVYQTTDRLDGVDHLVLVSPLFFCSLLLFGGIGWAISLISKL